MYRAASILAAPTNRLDPSLFETPEVVEPVPSIGASVRNRKRVAEGRFLVARCKVAVLAFRDFLAGRGP